LEKCSKYLDGVIFNVKKSIEEENEKRSLTFDNLKGNKIHKLKFYLKTHL